MVVLMGLILLFLSGVQPIFMVSLLILITLFYSFGLYGVMGGYWFGYALMMVVLSGILVVFTYMVSLIPNESFEVVGLVFLTLFVFLMSSGWFYLFMEDISFVCMDLWVSCVGGLNLFLVGFLLSMMLMVVWLSCMSGGALRVE